MFIRWTLPNGTQIWHRADMIKSVEKHSENRIQTMIMMSPQIGYAAEEEQADIVEAICSAMKTGIPQIVKRNALEDQPPGRLIS